MLYIKFLILNFEKFKDFLKIYQEIISIKSQQKEIDLDRWQDLIPEYSKSHFNLMDYFDEGYDKNKWSFESIMSYLLYRFDVDYYDCRETETGGIIEYKAISFPYGESNGLILFLNSFECKAFAIEGGFGEYTIKWTDDEYDVITNNI